LCLPLHFLPLWLWDQTFRCTTYSYDFLATEIYRPHDGNTPTSCFEWVVKKSSKKRVVKIGTGVTCTILSVDEYKILLCVVHGPKLQWPNCTRERDRGGNKERKRIFACDEVENVATQPGVITFTETHRTGGVLLAAPQIRVQSESDATTTSNDNIPEQSAASGLHAYTDQAGQTIFVTETDEQTPFFDMNREQ